MHSISEWWQLGKTKLVQWFGGDQPLLSQDSPPKRGLPPLDVERKKIPFPRLPERKCLPKRTGYFQKVLSPGLRRTVQS